MATKAKMEKQKKPAKYQVRVRNRCHVCGRPRAYFRKFDLCRICVRKLAHQGMLPGVIKASW
ncbi:MAG: type Z 30S ribosomal protein S14 [Deltaproteobacteria bacterium]|nr:type Z 30S ribosomal protein S14 [Deltaproteobacteria bacterium]